MPKRQGPAGAEIASELLGLDPRLARAMLHEHPDGFALREVVVGPSDQPVDLRTLYANESLPPQLRDGPLDREWLETAHTVLRTVMPKRLVTFDPTHHSWFEAFIFPVNDRVCGEFVRDVTDRQSINRVDVRDFGGLTIDYGARQVYLNGAEVDLTRSEFEVLALLSRSPGVVTRTSDLLAARDGAGWSNDDNAVGIIISRLRRKLGESAERPRYITTVRGIGYRFAP